MQLEILSALVNAYKLGESLDVGTAKVVSNTKDIMLCVQGKPLLSYDKYTDYFTYFTANAQSNPLATVLVQQLLPAGLGVKLWRGKQVFTSNCPTWDKYDGMRVAPGMTYRLHRNGTIVEVVRD